MSSFFIIALVPLIMMAGLVFDGGRVLAERRQVADVARGAAAAGVQRVETGAIRRGDVALRTAKVRQNAQAFLAAAGYSGTIEINGTSVTVTVTSTVNTTLSGLFGVHSKTVSGTGTARIVRGVEAADT